jgi:hypothetical protein
MFIVSNRSLIEVQRHHSRGRQIADVNSFSTCAAFKPKTIALRPVETLVHRQIVCMVDNDFHIR